MKVTRDFAPCVVLAALGLGAPGLTWAQPSHFVEVARAEDPLRRPFVLDYDTRGLVLADLDGDADLDLFHGAGIERLVQAERTEEGFAWARVISDHFNGDSGPVYDFPTFLDADGDGDLDLVYPGSFYTWGNYLAQTAPEVFAPRSGSENPFEALFPDGFQVWKAEGGDLDGDGDDDLVVGAEVSGDPATGRLYLVEQVTPGAFALRLGAEDPFAALTFAYGYAPGPTLADGDGDGDLDVVAACLRAIDCGGPQYRYFEQAEPGAFVERPVAESPVAGLEEYPFSDIDLVDFDGDADLDVFHAAGFGFLAYYERTPSGLVRHTGPYSLLGGFAFDNTIINFDGPLSFGDVDGDGDDDLVVGEDEGTLAYLRRTASAEEPFERRETQLNPFHWVQDAGRAATPALGDVDGDGDVDLVVGSAATWPSPGLRYIEQVEMNLFVERTDGENPFAGVTDVGYPALGDVDGDGDLDLVAGDRTGDRDRFRYLEQTAGGVFTERAGAPNPFDGLSARQCVNTPYQLPLEARPVLADLDRDGDLDLVSGRCFFQYRAAGFVPVWAPEANPLLDITLPSSDYMPRVSPYVGALADLNGDDHLDAVMWVQAGAVNGYQTYFNTGLAVADEPGAAGPASPYTLSQPAPNPTVGAARFTLSVAAAQVVRAALYDALGREVAVLYEGVVVPANPVAFQVEAVGLPAGVYIVEARGETFSAFRRLAITR